MLKTSSLAALALGFIAILASSSEACCRNNRCFQQQSFGMQCSPYMMSAPVAMPAQVVNKVEPVPQPQPAVKKVEQVPAPVTPVAPVAPMMVNMGGNCCQPQMMNCGCQPRCCLSNCFSGCRQQSCGMSMGCGGCGIR